eukprot:6428917-Prymnesium_polylepis.1
MSDARSKVDRASIAAVPMIALGNGTLTWRALSSRPRAEDACPGHRSRSSVSSDAYVSTRDNGHATLTHVTGRHWTAGADRTSVKQNATQGSVRPT